MSHHTENPTLLHELLHQFHKSHSSFCILYHEIPQNQQRRVSSANIMRILSASRIGGHLRSENCETPRHLELDLFSNDRPRKDHFLSESAIGGINGASGKRLGEALGVSMRPLSQTNAFQPLIRRTPRGEHSTHAIVQESHKRINKKRRILQHKMRIAQQGDSGHDMTHRYKERHVSDSLRIMPSAGQNQASTPSQQGRNFRRFNFVAASEVAVPQRSPPKLNAAPTEVSSSSIIKKTKRSAKHSPPATATRVRLHSPTLQNKLTQHSLHDAWLSAQGHNCETVIMDSMQEITQRERPLSSQGVTIAESMDEYQAAIKEWFEREYLQTYDELKEQIANNPSMLQSELAGYEKQIGGDSSLRVLTVGLEDDSAVHEYQRSNDEGDRGPLYDMEQYYEATPPPRASLGALSVSPRRVPVTRRYAAQRNNLRIRTAMQDIQKEYRGAIR